MKTLILNSSNVLPDGTNSRFVYTFPNGGFEFKDDFIAMQELAQYFSAFNISTYYNNKSFSYVWINGVTYNVTIPDGFYQVSDIYAYFRSVMVENSHYLLNASGGYVYLLELMVNQARYAVQLNSYLVSVAIASSNSWTLPPGATWVLPTNAILPYFVVTTNNFGLLIGFQPGQYPSGTITGAPPAQVQTPSYIISQSILSTIAPQITPYSSFLVYCTLVNNRAVIPNQLIFSYTPENATFGGLQSYKPNAELAWNKIENGVYNSFQVEFRDQLGRQVYFQDPNTLITLISKNKYEETK